MKIERPQARFGHQLALLGFSRFSNTLQLSPLAADIEIRYLPRMLLAIAMSLITAPLRLLEAML